MRLSIVVFAIAVVLGIFDNGNAAEPADLTVAQRRCPANTDKCRTDSEDWVEKEIRAMPEFSNGLLVGFAVAAVFLFGMQKRAT